MKTNKKGISLIVLAITIIVMIILASAIILSLSGRDIIGEAKEATSSSDLANAKHAVAVAKGEWKLGEVDSNYLTFKSYAEAKLQEAGLNGFNVSENGVVTMKFVNASGNQTAYIPEGFVASEAKGENTIEGGLVIYEGTEAVTDRNVKTARVERNQYVWVPVPNMSEFVRKDWERGVFSGTTSYNMSDVSEAETYLAMYNSVREYNGFYIARYEAGKEGENTLVSKKNAIIWDNIDFNGSKTECKKINTDMIQGHLIYGEEWDAALNFISKTDSEYATNSTEKGNYTPSLLKAGSSDAYAKSNIYDMAGNVWEWTMECESSTNKRILRGGGAAANGSGQPASYRGAIVASNKDNYNGFRLALYLK